MELRYCDQCGFRIPQEDIAAGRVTQSENSLLCLKCGPTHVAAAPIVVPFASASKHSASSINVRAVSRRPPVPNSTAPSSAQLNWLPVAGAIAAVLLALVVFSASSTPSHVASPAQEKPATITADAPVNPIDRPRTSQARTPPPRPATETPPIAVIPITAEAALEKEAQTAFDSLATGQSAEIRIKALEAFIEKYDQTMVSARAGAQLRELKAQQLKETANSPSAAITTAPPIDKTTDLAAMKPSIPIDDTDVAAHPPGPAAKVPNPAPAGNPLLPIIEPPPPAQPAVTVPNNNVAVAAAEAAWARVQKLADTKDRAGLDTALHNFKRNFGTLDIYTKNKSTIKIYETRSTPILIPEGLLAYLPLNDGAGAIAFEATGIAQDGQIKNCSWASEGSGSTLDCNGNNSVVSVGRVVLQTNSLTLCAWVKLRDSTGHYERFVTIPGDIAMIRRTPQNKFEFLLKINGKIEFTNSTEAPESNRWYFIAGTWDGKNEKLYRDGELLVNASHPGKIPTRNEAVLSWPDTESMSGLLSEARIYNRALSDAEIRQLADPKTRSTEK